METLVNSHCVVGLTLQHVVSKVVSSSQGHHNSVSGAESEQQGKIQIFSAQCNTNRYAVKQIILLLSMSTL